MPPCPHCKSPSVGNPCWWMIDRPEAAVRGNWDPPCYNLIDEFEDAARHKARRARRKRRLIRCAVVISVIVPLLIYLMI